MSRKRHCLSLECLQEPLLKTQPHTLTAGNPSDCVGAPRYTAGTWSRVVPSLVPVSTDEGTDVLKEAMGLAQRHTQQGKLTICQTPYPVFLARHHCQQCAMTELGLEVCETGTVAPALKELTASLPSWAPSLQSLPPPLCSAYLPSNCSIKALTFSQSKTLNILTWTVSPPMFIETTPCFSSLA